MAKSAALQMQASLALCVLGIPLVVPPQYHLDPAFTSCDASSVAEDRLCSLIVL